jgi:16S rRNA (cytosine967-C5)-methyltransferase
LGQLLPADANLVAVEPSSHRYKLLQENIRRLGLEKKVQTVHGRVGDLAEEGSEQYQGILVDAPCSGTGVIRRHPDIRWNRNLDDLKTYQHQQLEILQQSSYLLLPGGVLVYATCSMEPEENEQVIDAFLTANRDFSLSSATSCLPGPALELVSQDGYFSTTPASGLDGFFGARLVRKEK